MNELQFLADDIFLIYQRGIVFRGKVVAGCVAIGTRVLIQSRNAELEATVEAIELDRQLVPTSVAGPDIGLLLTDFDRASVNDRIRLPIDETNGSNLPSIECDLDIVLPVTVRAKGE
jgi:translation elongation factor EF-Tu-like GTPase